MEITLYYMQGTRSLRPRWLLEELQLPYELALIDLFKGQGQSDEYQRINPLGALPSIIIDGRVMTESGAICHWLTDRFPDSGLAPAPDSPERMQYERWMYFAPGTLEPMLTVIFYHEAILPPEQRIPEILPWARQQLEPVLAMLEHELAGKAYLLGEGFSSADIMIGSALAWIRNDLQPYPQLMAYVERLQARPAYQRAIEEPVVSRRAAAE